MQRSIEPWQIALARIEGAMPFLSEPVGEVLAMRGLRRMWQVHARDFPSDALGRENDGGPDRADLMRSWLAIERQDFLWWVTRRAPPPLARAARVALRARGERERFTAALLPADTALGRLDALLPTSAPLETLGEWIAGLREEETAFFEGGSELVALGDRAIARSVGRGAAWAASLAVALRPHLFGLGKAPVVLAGIAPRRLFRAHADEPAERVLGEALSQAAAEFAADLPLVHRALEVGTRALSTRYASSRAPAAWRLVLGLGPLTRAEIARALSVTARTASQAVAALEQANLVHLRAGDGAVIAKVPQAPVP